MSSGNSPVKLKFSPLTSCDDLKDFRCGVEEMDVFIHNRLKDSISGGYCKAFAVYQGAELVAFYALNFDALVLDDSGKEDIKSLGVGVDDNYSSLFWDKLHYPALEISYLAVRKDKRDKGIGRSILAEIYGRALEQCLAGCQFITVEAYKRPASYDGDPYSAMPFYSKFGFQAVELPNPGKETIRMCLPLPSVWNDD